MILLADALMLIDKTIYSRQKIVVGMCSVATAFYTLRECEPAKYAIATARMTGNTASQRMLHALPEDLK